ncbi:MAG: hypothetical protein KDC98_08970 [Planctomycetes bacterium]|nr:hypothetical protein [Planctomycetota bacterium]
MRTTAFLPLLASTLAFPTTATAQITYVDADFSTNTTHADGTPHTPTIGSFANDNFWQVRPFANGTTIISSNDTPSGSEDCPMLRTRISGLIPTLPYIVYGYQWSTQSDSAQWRLQMQVDTQQPSGPLTLWHTKGAGSPMSTPLCWDSYTSPVTSLGLQYDTLGNETAGHFTSTVMIREGNRCLYEIPLGIFAASPAGEIDVYIDDDPQVGNYYRNWYDGVGYALAPLASGNGCGASIPLIGFSGEPTMLRDFTIELSGGNPNSLALLTFGLHATTWNGLTLPVPLASFGFAGCFLNVNSQFNILTMTDASGSAAQTYNLTGLPSIDLDWQWGVLNAGSGAAMTSGLSTTIHQ